MFRALSTLALLLGLACQTPASIPGDLVDDAGTRLALPVPPGRIVSLIPATTELVFALGQGERLVGRTSWCDYPARAAEVPDLGNGIDPNVEAVLQARPDLVLLYRSGANARAVGQLRGLGVPVAELATDRIEDLTRITLLLGRVLGVTAAAESLVAGIERDLDAASRPSGRPADRPTIFILAWNRPPLTLGRGSFLSEVVERAGARNIFDDLSAPSAPVAIEAVASRDPDYILTSGVDLPSMARLDEWRVLRAV
ncbi:MAG TPA: helical backbone metal receptor, partial [Gemmatimonadales bacterium]|nr:helical backbone metal receptor [Gemmatimonadales bacterium]